MGMLDEGSSLLGEGLSPENLRLLRLSVVAKNCSLWASFIEVPQRFLAEMRRVDFQCMSQVLP